MREALKTSSFWLLSLSGILWFWAYGSALVHQVAFAKSIGIPEMAAAGGVSFLTGFSIAGRLGFGRLGDIFNKRYLMMVAVALQMIGYVVLLRTENITMFYIYASLVGLGMGGLVPILSAIFAEYFGRTNYGAVYGLSTFLRWIGMAVGPTYAGWIFDTTGSYHIAFLTCIILAFIAIILLGWLKAPKRAEKD